MNLNTFKQQLLSRVPKIDEKNRYYVIAGILLFIFLSDYFLIMQPQLKTLVTLNPKITLLAKDYKKAKEDIKKYEQYKQDVIDLKNKRELMGNSIPLREEIPSILDNISRIADREEVRINQIMPLKDSQKLILSNEDGDYYSLPVLIDARGGYHDIGRFFNQIEKDQRFMRITDFEITANSTNQYRHLLRVTIQAAVLDKKQELKKKKK